MIEVDDISETPSGSEDRIERMRAAIHDLTQAIEITAGWIESAAGTGADQELAAFHDELAACVLRLQGQLQLLDDNVWIVDDEMQSVVPASD